VTRRVVLDELELTFCRHMGNRREDAALGYVLKDGGDPFRHLPGVEFGEPSGDARIKGERQIHFQGVAGELAFCKAFDIYYPNRLRDAHYSYIEDDAVWSGDPKDADVSDDIEVRSVGPHAKFVCVKKNDNRSFNVVVVRRLRDDCSEFDILGYRSVGEVMDGERKTSDWCNGYMLPLADLKSIESLTFAGAPLSEYEAAQELREQEKSSPYRTSLIVHGAVEMTDVEFIDQDREASSP
jgi:hypothetical protein